MLIRIITVIRDLTVIGVVVVQRCRSSSSGNSSNSDSIVICRQEPVDRSLLMGQPVDRIMSTTCQQEHVDVVVVVLSTGTYRQVPVDR